MPPSRRPDQAEGLRRLLGSRALRAIVVAAGHRGVGKTTLVVNLATALAATGREILLLDENAGPGGVGAALGLKVRYELLHVLEGDRLLNEVILQGPPGLRVLPAARGVRALANATPVRQARALASCPELARPVDLVLVDAADAQARRQLPYGLPVDETVLLTTPGPEAVVETYALIKQLAQRTGVRRARLIINRARGEAQARAISTNVQAVARHHLNVEVDCLGVVPEDVALRQAGRLCKPVLETEPEGRAAGTLRQLAARLCTESGARCEPDGLGEFLQRWLQLPRLAPAHA